MGKWNRFYQSPLCLVAQSCPAVCIPMDACIPARLLCLWGFSRQEYWSGLPFLPPEDLPNPGIEPRSPALQADSLPSEPCSWGLIFHPKFTLPLNLEIKSWVRGSQGKNDFKLQMCTFFSPFEFKFSTLIWSMPSLCLILLLKVVVNVLGDFKNFLVVLWKGD